MGTWCRWSPPDRELSEAERQKIREWLRAHEVDPGTVKAMAVMGGPDGDELHLTVYATNERGERFVDYAANEAVTERRIMPCRVDPPLPDEGSPQQIPYELRQRLIRLGWIAPS